MNKHNKTTPADSSKQNDKSNDNNSIKKEDEEQHKSHEKHYDQTLKDSFPASDPPPHL